MMSSNEKIERNNNVVSVSGDFRDYHFYLSQIYQGIEKYAYSDIVLDMQDCTSAFQGAMLAVCAQVLGWRNSEIEFRLIPPKDKRLSNLFKNTNWGHLLDPTVFEESGFRGYSRVPATQYQSPDEQRAAVNRIVNVILGALPDIERSDFAAFEWVINELTDNVLVHSESPVGGLVQVSTFERNRKVVQFVIADPGIGVPKSLKSGFPDIGSDTEALDRAIREGVTRDKKIGQGNGMFGSFQVCSESDGELLIDSGHACLKYGSSGRKVASNSEASGSRLTINNMNIPYSGTLIVASIAFDDPNLLANALRFGGKKYSPVDYVESNYEENDREELVFSLAEECRSFGTRVSGTPIQRKLFNLYKMNPGLLIKIDFTGVALMSSSFADEAFAKLFLKIGPIKFMSTIKLVGMGTTVASLVDRAIEQRMAVGDSDVDE